MSIPGIDVAAVRECLAEVEQHLHHELLPFWIERSPDLAVGGFLTHFDRNGAPTGRRRRAAAAQRGKQAAAKSNGAA